MLGVTLEGLKMQLEPVGKRTDSELTGTATGARATLIE